jgi:hypothetical protein
MSELSDHDRRLLAHDWGTNPECGCRCAACGLDGAHDHCSHAHPCRLSREGREIAEERQLVRRLREDARPRGAPDAAARWARTLDLWRAEHWAASEAEREADWSGDEGAGWGLARCRLKTRLFLPGDVGILWFCNGQGERWPITCRTQRGYDVTGLYVQVRRSHGGPRRTSYAYSQAHRMADWQYKELDKGAYEDTSDRTRFELVELPGELARKAPTDSAVRGYVLETCSRRDAAGPVAGR